MKLSLAVALGAIALFKSIGGYAIAPQKASVFYTSTQYERAYLSVLAGVKQCILLRGWADILARGDVYQDIRPSALVVSYPYPTDSIDVYSVKIEQDSGLRSKVTVIQRADFGVDVGQMVKHWINGGTDCFRAQLLPGYKL